MEEATIKLTIESSSMHKQQDNESRLKSIEPRPEKYKPLLREEHYEMRNLVLIGIAGQQGI